MFQQKLFALADWFLGLVSGRPHVYIGGRENPYMLRWFLLPRNRWLNIYLHKFLRDDDDRALHDHPWWFVSLVLSGSYLEYTESGVFFRQPWSIAFRRAEHRHRVALLKCLRTDDPHLVLGECKPCWTLIVTGRKRRLWGFWCPKGFVPWHEFVAKDDHGSIGKGCE